MTEPFIIDSELVDELSPREKVDHSGIRISSYDAPKEIRVIGIKDQWQMAMIYSDNEPEGDPEMWGGISSRQIVVYRGKHSGKILRLSGFTEMPNQATFAELASAIQAKAPTMKRKNQELNFFLISRILDYIAEHCPPPKPPIPPA